MLDSDFKVQFVIILWLSFKTPVIFVSIAHQKPGSLYFQRFSSAFCCNFSSHRKWRNWSFMATFTALTTFIKILYWVLWDPPLTIPPTLWKWFPASNDKVKQTLNSGLCLSLTTKLSLIKKVNQWTYFLQKLKFFTNVVWCHISKKLSQPLFWFSGNSSSYRRWSS